MPYLPSQNNEEENPQQFDGNGMPILSGQGGTISTGSQLDPSKVSAPAGGPDRPSSSGFTNISKYLEANKPQSQQLAQNVGQVITTQADKADTSIKSAQDEFNTAAKSATAETSSDLFNKVRTSPTALSEAESNQIKSLRQAEYKGPTALDQVSSFNPAVAEVKKAEDYATSSTSDEGRKQLLRDIQKNRQASQGVTSLNNLLLTGKPQQEILAESAKSVDPLTARLEAARQASTVTAKESQLKTADTVSQVNKLLADERLKAEQALKSQAKSAQAIRAADLKAAQEILAGGALLDPTSINLSKLSTVGMTPAQYAELIAARDSLSNPNTIADLSGYLVNTPQSKQAADASQLARLASLGQLAGINPDLTGLSSYNLDSQRFDLTKALSDIQAAKTEEARVAAALAAANAPKDPGKAGATLPGTDIGKKKDSDPTTAPLEGLAKEGEKVFKKLFG